MGFQVVALVEGAVLVRRAAGRVKKKFSPTSLSQKTSTSMKFLTELSTSKSDRVSITVTTREMSRDYEDGNGAPAKRQKVTNGNTHKDHPTSRIFAPFRASISVSQERARAADMRDRL